MSSPEKLSRAHWQLQQPRLGSLNRLPEPGYQLPDVLTHITYYRTRRGTLTSHFEGPRANA